MLYIDIDKFNFYSINEIKDGKEEILYWTQYDFSFKKRLHLYKNNFEIGYVQYDILSSNNCNECFDSNDKKIEYNDYKIINVIDENNYEIELLGEIKAIITKSNNILEISIKDEKLVDDIVLLVFKNIKV